MTALITKQTANIVPITENIITGVVDGALIGALVTVPPPPPAADVAAGVVAAADVAAGVVAVVVPPGVHPPVGAIGHTAVHAYVSELVCNH